MAQDLAGHIVEAAQRLQAILDWLPPHRPAALPPCRPAASAAALRGVHAAASSAA